ncbi:putative nuclear mrna splicing factor-associated protein [Cladorrhinum sp. PSN332]|nr:putative nuclear mrna splicing factor-associated protein [Cladorrhinum sp. PSN332]
MSIVPFITFKAGICHIDRSSRPYKVKCDPRPGYIYLFPDDSELIQFAWRPRENRLDDAELELTMVPGDGHFTPYETNKSSSKTNGRVFALKFASSSTRHLFWLQSKPQGRSGNPAWFSPRDLKIGEIVDQMLQGEEVDVHRELATVRNDDDDSPRDADDDETMEDIEGHGDPHAHHQSGNGGAGPDATGGDFREEGSDSREGGADGARAASSNPDAAAAVQNFLDSLKGNPSLGGGGSQSAQGKAYPLLNDLLDSSTTISMLDSAPDAYVDHLLDYLPPVVLVLSQQGENGDGITKEPSAESVEAAKEAMSSDQKRSLVKRVLRSPQFNQSLASLTSALRDGGLPSVAEALGIPVANGGRVTGGTVPLGGGDAIDAFVEGDDFDQDDRISFSRLDNKYIAVQEDGTEYEFDEGLKRWVPMIDDELIEAQQRGYMMPGVDDEEEAGPAQGRKRKMDHSDDREDSYNNNNNNGRSSKNSKQAKRQQPTQPKQNTAVYVTGIPFDATVDEVAELFSRKCGVIAEEIDSGRPRIKMYTDAEGNFKGDALVVFFKPQSVDMAIMLLDDTDFRFTPSGLTSGKIRVQAAEMSYKKTKYDDAAGADGDKKPAAEESSSNNKKPQARSLHDKAKIIRKTQKLSAKLADWSDDEEIVGPSSKAKGGKWDKVVILRHMFTLEELDEDPVALLDIKEDIREECAKLGPVTNVVLFDKEEEGIVSVRFGTIEAAEACVRLMHGRAFDGRTVEAFFATGREKFRKSRDNGGNGGGDDNDSD